MPKPQPFGKPTSESIKDQKDVESGEERRKTLIKEPIKTLRKIGTHNHKTSSKDKGDGEKEGIASTTTPKETKEGVTDHEVNSGNKSSAKDQAASTPKKTSLLNDQTLNNIVLTETSLVEANQIKLNSEDIIGYTSYLDDHLNLDLTVKGNWFRPITRIPCLYNQQAFEIDAVYTASQIRNGVKPQLVNKSEIYEVSDDKYKQTTSLILLELKPSDYPGELVDDIDKFNEELNPFTSIIISDTFPQQNYQYKIFGNLLVKICSLLKGSDFIITDLQFASQETRLAPAAYGTLLEGEEVTTTGTPHLAYISSIFNNSYIESAIFKALTNNNVSAVKTGRVPNSAVRVNSMPILYEAYVHTDQFTALLNNYNTNWIIKNRLSLNVFLGELRAFTTANTVVQTDQLQPFFQDFCYRSKFSTADHENVLLSYFLFPALSIQTTQFITDIIIRLDILRSSSCIEWLVQNQSGKQDQTVLTNTLANIKLAPKENLVNLIVLEATRQVSDFNLNIISPVVGLGTITQLYDIFICATFFPYIFSKLVYVYYPILYQILNSTIPDQMAKFVARYGFYSRQLDDGSWVNKPVEVYTKIHFDEGIMPSLMVKDPQDNILRKIKEALKPVYYPYVLNQKRQAGYPYIAKNYTYQSSWPVTELSGGYSEDAYLLRVETMFNTLSLIVDKMITRNGPLIFRKITVTNNSSVQSISAFTAALLPLIREAASTLARIAGPLMLRFYQTPLLPGNIVDVMHSMDDTAENYPTSNVLGVYAKRISKFRRPTEREIGYAPKSISITFEALQFLNFATSLTGPGGRGVYTGITRNKNPLAFEVIQIDPMELYKTYDSLCGQVKLWCSQLFTYLATIDPYLYPEYYNKFQNLMPTRFYSKVAKEILNFMESHCFLSISSVFTIFKNSAGNKVLADPRGYNFTLGIISPTLNVVVDEHPTTFLGHEFQLADDLHKNKMSLITHVLTSDKLPNLRMGDGLAVGCFTTEKPCYRDIAPEPESANYWEPNVTFTYEKVENPNIVGNMVTKLAYHYYQDDVRRTAYQPLDLKGRHSLVVEYPTDIQNQDQRKFIRDAIELGKLTLYITKLKYLWNIYFPKILARNETFGKETIDVIFNIGTTQDIYPEVTLIDGSQLFQISTYQIQGTITRMVLPLTVPLNLVVLTGLYDNTVTREPYISDGFFKYSFAGESDQQAMARKINGSPNINNKIKVFTQLAKFDLPDVTFVYGDELY